MAEIIERARNSKRGPHKMLRVDLTPMVDLGFLLITFFILTASLETPKELSLILPRDTTADDPVAESTALTVMLLGKDSIGYSEGSSERVMYDNIRGLRSIIQSKQKRIVQANKPRDLFTLIIKPFPESTYGNFIEVMDEITINDCRHYYVSR